MISRCRRIAAAAALVAALLPPAGHAAAGQALDEARTESLAAFEAGDCAKVWNLLWPLAKSGEAEARALLFGALWQGGLVPPGRSGDRITFLRDATILSAYGSTDGDQAATEFFKGVVAALPGDISGEAARTCGGADAASSACLDAGVASGLLPTFEDFAAEIDAVAKAGAVGAKCTGLVAPGVPEVEPVLPAR